MFEAPYVDMRTNCAVPMQASLPSSTAAVRTGCPHGISQWIIGGIVINRIYGDGDELRRTKTVGYGDCANSQQHTAAFTTDHGLLTTCWSVCSFFQRGGDFDSRDTTRGTTFTCAPVIPGEPKKNPPYDFC